MKKNTENQPEDKSADPIMMRRDFIMATTLLGLGTMAAWVCTLVVVSTPIIRV